MAERTRSITRLVASLVVLDASVTFLNWWPTPGVRWLGHLSVELAMLTLVLSLLHRHDRPAPRGVVRGLTIVWLLLVLGRYADVTAPSLFGRPVNLYWDLPQLPRFLWVSALDRPAWQSAGVLAAATAGAWLLFTLVRLCLRSLLHTVVPWTLQSFPAWLLSFGAALLAAAHVAQVPGTGRWVANAVLPTYARQLGLLWDAHAPGRLAYALPPLTAIEDAQAQHGPDVLAGLGRRDVAIVFLESFGAVLYDHADVRAATEAGRRALQHALADSGRQVVSGFFRSPTIGGASDLAHLSLLSGVDLSDPRRHHLLMTTQRPTLLHLFRQSGYQTFGVYHAVSWPWPERAYYGFDHYLDGPALGYRGPPVTFWKIPDQAALALYEQRHPRTAQGPPRLLFFPTISSHFPFHPAPPYQPDWRRLTTDAPFDEPALSAALRQPLDWLDMRRQYAACVDYVYRWLAGHFERPEPRDTVYVLLGDHQPTANITGERVPWDVPVHIVSRDRELLERFKALGFTDGLWPDRAVLGGLHHLTSILLSGFGPRPAPH